MKPDCTHLNLPAPDAACGPKPAEQQGAALPQGASDALVHQLHAHQVELHAQTQALHDIQRELKESRDRYISLFEHAPTAYLLLDEKGRISELNRPAAALFGQDRRKLLHRRFSRFLHPDSTDTWHLFLRNELQHVDRQTCELKLRRSDGDGFWARLVGHRKTELYCGGGDSCGDGESVLDRTIRMLEGCEAVLCSKIGIEPWNTLEAAGIKPDGEHGMEPIEEAVMAVWNGMLAAGKLATPLTVRKRA